LCCFAGSFAFVCGDPVKDISVKLSKLELRNPIVVASGDIGCHVGQIKEAEHFGAAAFITKGCIPTPDASGLTRKSRIRIDFRKNALKGLAGFRRLGLAEAGKLISDAKKEVRIPVGANVFVMLPTEEEKEIVTIAARELCRKGADFIELDTTGNLPVHFGETRDSGGSGEYFSEEMAGKYPRFVYETIKAVKEVVDVPVLGKVAYENINVPVLISAMEEAGVDIIDIGNAGMGVMPGIMDIYNPDRMGGDFVSADKSLSLCLTGDALRRFSQAYIIRSAKSVRTPILGCGGIMGWRHIIEAIMCGAAATSICTAFVIRGFEIIQKMKEGLIRFMEEQGYDSLEELRGLFLDKIALTPGEIEVFDVVAKVDNEKCNGCGLCAKPAHCGLTERAIKMVNKKAVVDETQCLGCETCASICPETAITMVGKK
jgi:dihydropyrimidine dehydrogenase (NAD+) subunit PreA